jgi:hypothetical protein
MLRELQFCAEKVSWGHCVKYLWIVSLLQISRFTPLTTVGEKGTLAAESAAENS